MKKIAYVIGLSIVFVSCFKKQKTNTKGSNDKVSTNLVLDNKSESATAEKEYFSDIEEFKNFIMGKKWVDLADGSPCHPHGQSITVKDGYIHEYNTIEPSIYKVDTIFQIDSKTLGLKIKSELKHDVVFKVEVLNIEERLVKWVYHYETEYEARPYQDICSDYKIEMHKSKESQFNKIWEGSYRFSDAEEGADWREGRDYDLYISLDSINLKSYGYQHLKNTKCYAIQKEDSLFIYRKDEGEGLQLKLFVIGEEYIASSLIDKKGVFNVLKKNNK